MSDRPEIESLWRESSARLRAWFQRHTRSRSDAEDLVQETFVRVHEHMGTLVDAGSVRAWLGRIARNVLADHRRRSAVRGLPGNGDALAALERTEDPDLEATVSGWLEDFMALLDPLDAEALRLVDLQGRTQRELAEAHGLSLSGAKSRVQRARARLRARLEACCAFAFDARGGLLGYERRAGEDCSDCGCDEAR